MEDISNIFERLHISLAGDENQGTCLPPAQDLIDAFITILKEEKGEQNL